MKYLILAPQCDLHGNGSMNWFLQRICSELHSKNLEYHVIDQLFISNAIKERFWLQLLSLCRCPSMIIYWLISYFYIKRKAGFDNIIAVSQEYVLPFLKHKQTAICYDLIQSYFPRNFQTYCFYKLLEKYLLRRVKNVLCPTITTIRYVKKYANVANSVLLGVPINNKYLNTEHQLKTLNSVRSSDFVWVGTTGSHKRLFWFLASVKMACDRGFYLVGNIIVPSKENNVVQNEISRLGLSKCLSVKSNLSDLAMNNIYLATKFYVSSSRLEGFGMPALEAALCGCQPILTNIAVYRELYSSISFFYSCNNYGKLIDFLTLSSPRDIESLRNDAFSIYTKYNSAFDSQIGKISNV